MSLPTEPGNPMQPRRDFYKASPDAAKAMLALEAAVKKPGLEPGLVELVKLRASLPTVQPNQPSLALASAPPKTDRPGYRLNAPVAASYRTRPTFSRVSERTAAYCQ